MCQQHTPYADRMAVSLRPMLGSEIPEFIAASQADYIADRVASGEDLAVATRIAEEQVAALFPDGQPGSGHHLYRVEENGEQVGSLSSWLAVSAACAQRPRSRSSFKLLASRYCRHRSRPRSPQYSIPSWM